MNALFRAGTAVTVKFCIRKMLSLLTPEIPAKPNTDLHEAECVRLPSEENAVPVEQMRSDALIAMAAEMMRRNLAKQGITVPAFNPDP